MTTPSDRPERQSRARNGLSGDGAAPLPARPTSLPEIGAERAVDLDRLRASAASAIDAEQAASPLGARSTRRQARADGAPGGAPSSAPGSASRASGGGAPAPGAPSASSPAARSAGAPAVPTRTSAGTAESRAETGFPGWLKVALPIGVVAALATVGVALSGGGSADEAAPAPTTVAALPRTSAPASTEAPAADEPSTAPTTAAPATTATTAAPAAPAVADPAAPPPHKATYRGGKLYLEGRITSDAEAQKYVEKAAAVLGPDNVVNNYVVDPSVPLSTDGTVYVDEPFLFETGSSQLNPQYTGVLGLGVAALKLNPAARMVVTGYTDNKGDPSKNQELSLARANAVVDYMVTSGGIDRTRFDAIGAGDQNPVGDNNTEEGRALNRRIDVKLVDLLG